MSEFAPLAPLPYYAVIFTAKRTDGDHGYQAMADAMNELAATRPGFIGIDSARDAEGFGITVSYWRTEADVLGWKADAKHLLAQKLGRERWYEYYCVRVARVERSYEGPEGR